jgi:hypothetical protein
MAAKAANKTLQEAKAEDIQEKPIDLAVLEDAAEVWLSFLTTVLSG